MRDSTKIAIERRQLELVLGQRRVGNIGAVALSGAISAACLSQVGWHASLIWTTVVFAAFALRAWATRTMPARLAEVADTRGIARQIALLHGIIGLAIASAGWWFLGALDSRSQFVLIMVLVGWPAGGISVLGGHAKSFAIYLLCYFGMLGSAWWHYHANDWLALVGFAVYALALGSLSRNLSQVIGTVWSLEQEKDVLLKRQGELIHSLEAAKAEAEQSNLAKSWFLASASHELAQPVASISLTASTLKQESLKEPWLPLGQKWVREATANLKEASDSLKHRFEALMNISALEVGKVKLDVQQFSVDDLFAKVQSVFGERATARSILLKTKASGMDLKSDSQHVERIVFNLVENAIRATKKGGISLTFEESGGEFALAVADTGIGIDRSDRERIFEKYYQVPQSSKQRKVGMGLGLAIVRGTCDLLGFRIDVQSESGRGSTFRILIPKELVSKKGLQPAPKRTAEGVDLKNLEVVVLDNDAGVGRALVSMLASWGASAIAFESGAAFRERLSTGKLPDIVIIDYDLGESENGLQIAHDIDKLDPSVKIVVITGAQLPDAALESNRFDVLRKHTLSEELPKSLRAMLDQPD